MLHEYDAVSYGVAVTMVILAVLWAVVELSKQLPTPDVTYYGNQDKLNRPVDGTTQVTYKGR